ncbi:MAG TPA: hypothetical protein DEO82_02400 [Eubacterium sp.]|nr:hypothetical protein [Eubacterium sp.]
MNSILRKITLFSAMTLFIVGLGTNCFAKDRYYFISVAGTGSDHTSTYTNSEGMRLNGWCHQGSVDVVIQYRYFSTNMYFKVPGCKSTLKAGKSCSLYANPDYSKEMRGYIEANWNFFGSYGDADLIVYE